MRPTSRPPFLAATTTSTAAAATRAPPQQTAAPTTEDTTPQPWPTSSIVAVDASGHPLCPAGLQHFPPKPSFGGDSQRVLEEAGCYDLRVFKDGQVLGCAAPVNLFPGNEKYGCAGPFDTAKTCDAAPYPIKDTKYVWAVHAGCKTAEKKGTYGYAYDDGVGLKQCSPLTKYEWILCPTGQERPIGWHPESIFAPAGTTRRFRVTNKCQHDLWIQQAGSPGTELPSEPKILHLAAGSEHTYAVPDKGLASTRFVPKVGCDSYGNNCLIQSIQPCPAGGCDVPIDTKFEASWGCMHASGDDEVDRKVCALTGQGNPSTFQDWWDGSAVDGWTLPFSVLTDDGGRGLTKGAKGSPESCGDVVCAELDADLLCPRDEFLTPLGGPP